MKINTKTLTPLLLICFLFMSASIASAGTAWVNQDQQQHHNDNAWAGYNGIGLWSSGSQNQMTSGFAGGGGTHAHGDLFQDQTRILGNNHWGNHVKSNTNMYEGAIGDAYGSRFYTDGNNSHAVDVHGHNNGPGNMATFTGENLHQDMWGNVHGRANVLQDIGTVSFTEYSQYTGNPWSYATHDGYSALAGNLNGGPIKRGDYFGQLNVNQNNATIMSQGHGKQTAMQFTNASLSGNGCRVDVSGIAEQGHRYSQYMNNGGQFWQSGSSNTMVSMNP